LKNSRSSPTSLSPASVVTTWRYSVTTHTHKQKKLDGKYLTQEYENPKGFSASNDGDKDCISAERERGGETERERVCECWRRLSCLLSTTGVADICERTSGPIFHVLW
jgi:hypothetical protein